MNGHIIVVDDERQILVTMEILLASKGYRVTAVENGEQALGKIVAAAADKNQYDLLISDMQMPLMSGVELMQNLNDLGINIPVLAVTGCGDEKLLKTLISLNCREFLDKPFSEEELIRKIEKLICPKEDDVEKKYKVKNLNSVYLKQTLKAYKQSYKSLQGEMTAMAAAFKKMAFRKIRISNIDLKVNSNSSEDISTHFFTVRKGAHGCSFLMADLGNLSPASLYYYSAMLNVFFDVVSSTRKKPEKIMESLHHLILDDENTRTPIPAALLKIDLMRSEMSLISAGFSSSIYIRGHNMFSRFNYDRGMALGSGPDAGSVLSRIRIDPGDRIIIYSEKRASAMQRDFDTQSGGDSCGLGEIISSYSEFDLANMQDWIWGELNQKMNRRAADTMQLISMEIQKSLKEHEMSRINVDHLKTVISAQKLLEQLENQTA